MELETAVRLKLNLVHMVWIDGTYDMVAVQEQAKYKRTSGGLRPGGRGQMRKPLAQVAT